MDLPPDQLLRIAPVLDAAVAVEPVRLLGEEGGIEGGVVVDHVEDEPDASGLRGLRQRDQIVLAAEPRLDAAEVLHPVAVKRTVAVEWLGAHGEHRRDPEGANPERVEIGQPTGDPSQIATVKGMGIGEVYGVIVARIAVVKAINKHEVDQVSLLRMHRCCKQRQQRQHHSPERYSSSR